MGQYKPLKNLKVLNLSQNKLKVLHKNTFEHIKQIEELHLGYNGFGEINSSTKSALKMLKQLKFLNLSCCSLETLPDDFVFERLEYLDLSENLFLNAPDVLVKLKSLEVLYMNANPILELHTTR